MTLDRNEDTGVLTITGDLQFPNVKPLHEAVLAQLNSKSDIVLNLAGVERCDAAAIQVFVVAQKTAAVLGKSLSFSEVSQVVNQNAGALGLQLERVAKAG